MRKLTFLLSPLLLITLLFPALASGETMDDLVKREGLYYKKFTERPFTGKVTGRNQGLFKNGKRNGPWVRYHSNGQLWFKVTYKDFKREGPWVEYRRNGQLWVQSTFKNGKQDGLRSVFWENGQIMNTQLYRDGKRVGPLVLYNEDGTVSERIETLYVTPKKDKKVK